MFHYFVSTSFVTASLLRQKSFFRCTSLLLGPTIVTGFFRFGVWRSIFRAKQRGIAGNFEGEGRILGRLLVLSERKGIVFQYDEKEFGDHADLKDVLDAAKQLAIV